MDCAGVASCLVAYHFGQASERENEAIDAHLVACTSCLRTYLALKHATEKAPHDRPSPEVKATLRAHVARKSRKSREQAARRTPLYARRIPLYQCIALAAVAAAMTFVLPRAIDRTPIQEGTPQVDTARPSAESLTIY